MKCEMTLYYLLKITYYRKRKTNKKNIIADFKSENYCVLIQIELYLATDSREPIRFNKQLYSWFYLLLTITHPLQLALEVKSESLLTMFPKHFIYSYNKTETNIAGGGGGEFFLIRG